MTSKDNNLEKKRGFVRDGQFDLINKHTYNQIVHTSAREVFGHSWFKIQVNLNPTGCMLISSGFA